MNKIVGLLVACLTAARAFASNPNPQSFLAHLPDLNMQDAAKLLTADQSGSFFIISSRAKTFT
jgi:hypothetical protein